LQDSLVVNEDLPFLSREGIKIHMTGDLAYR